MSGELVEVVGYVEPRIQQIFTHLRNLKNIYYIMFPVRARFVLDCNSSGFGTDVYIFMYLFLNADGVQNVPRHNARRHKLESGGRRVFTSHREQSTH